MCRRASAPCILYNILRNTEDTDGAVHRMFLSSHLFWTSDYTFRYNNIPGMDDPTGVTQEEGHIGIEVLFIYFTFYNKLQVPREIFPYSLYTPQGGYLAEFPGKKLAGV